jgi:hypothetical protein
MDKKSAEESEVVCSEASPGRECLAVVLRPQLVLARIHTWPLMAFVCNGNRYYDAGFGEWTDFYDWLRDDPDGNVVGVRCWLSSETAFLGDYAKDLGYVKVDPSRNLEIYFSDRRLLNRSRSCDQDFLYNALFRSDDGYYALAFGMGGLNRRDLLSLQNIGSGWDEAQPAE